MLYVVLCPVLLLLLCRCDYVVNGSVLLPTVQTQQMSDSLNKTGRPIWFLFHCIGYGIVDSTWCAEWGNSYTVSTDSEWLRGATLDCQLTPPCWVCNH